MTSTPKGQDATLANVDQHEHVGKRGHEGQHEG